MDGTHGMDRPRECSQEDASCQSQGVNALREEQKDGKPTEVSLFVVGGDKRGKKIKSEPEPGAAAGGSGGCAGAGFPTPGNDDEDPELKQLEEQGPMAAEGLQLPDVEHHAFRNTFSPLKLQELERVFQRTQYPDVFAGKELEIPMSVTEAGLQLSKSEKTNLPGKPF